MFHTPAHKQLDPAKQGAQRVNPVSDNSGPWNGPTAHRLNANGRAAAKAQGERQAAEDIEDRGLYSAQRVARAMRRDSNTPYADGYCEAAARTRSA